MLAFLNLNIPPSARALLFLNRFSSSLQYQVMHTHTYYSRKSKLLHFGEPITKRIRIDNNSESSSVVVS